MSKKTIACGIQTFIVESDDCEIIPLKNLTDTVDEIKRKYENVPGEHCASIQLDNWDNEVSILVTTYREETDAEYEQRMAETRRAGKNQFVNSLHTLVNLSDSEIDTMLATLNQIKSSRI